MKISATRSRRFVVVSCKPGEETQLSEQGAAPSEALAGCIAFGLIRFLQNEGFNDRFFVVDVKYGATHEYLIDKNSKRSSIIRLETPITNIIG